MLLCHSFALVTKVTLERKALRVYRVLKDSKAYKVLKDFKESRVR